MVRESLHGEYTRGVLSSDPGSAVGSCRKVAPITVAQKTSLPGHALAQDFIGSCGIWQWRLLVHMSYSM